MDRTITYIPGEERCGYYVQPLMKRIWAVQLDILKVIDTICTRHGLNYSAWYGTLLGAVRHHGFIPWDDDMDLAMLREDYEKFQYYCRTELPDGWSILRTSPTLIRVLNTDIIRLEQEFLDNFHGCPFVMGVDIFSLDHIPLSKDDEKLWLNLFSIIFTLHEHWDLFKDDAEWKKNKWQQLKEVESLTGYCFNGQRPILDQLHELADNIAAMYWDAESEEVAIISTLTKNSAYRIPVSYLKNFIKVPFEDMTIPILENYDLPCRLSYGKDYMIPVRIPGHSQIQEQVDVLRQYFKEQGKELPEFFNMTVEE